MDAIERGGDEDFDVDAGVYHADGPRVVETRVAEVGDEVPGRDADPQGDNKKDKAARDPAWSAA